MGLPAGSTVLRGTMLTVAVVVLTAAVFQTRGRHSSELPSPADLRMTLPLTTRPAQPAPPPSLAVARAEPAATPSAAPATPPEAPAPQPRRADRELALTLVPALLEMGVAVMPMGSDDDGRAVLKAVNGLRRQEGLPLFEHIDQAVADYVDIKVDQYRERLANTLRIQIALTALGFNPGPIDGLRGPLTTRAIRRYQQSARMPVTGELTDEEIDALETLSFDKSARAPGG